MNDGGDIGPPREVLHNNMQDLPRRTSGASVFVNLKIHGRPGPRLDKRTFVEPPQRPIGDSGGGGVLNGKFVKRKGLLRMPPNYKGGLTEATLVADQYPITGNKSHPMSPKEIKLFL